MFMTFLFETFTVLLTDSYWSPSFVSRFSSSHSPLRGLVLHDQEDPPGVKLESSGLKLQRKADKKVDTNNSMI